MAKNETATITVRVTTEDKKAFEEFCKAVGITPSTAINMFIKNTLMNDCLPFSVAVTPNRQERELLSERMTYNPKTGEYQPYTPKENKDEQENGRIIG